MITEILNYTIVKKLGEGAMGQVFLAKNKSIHQFVAIKMLHPRFSTNPVLRDRFRQEAIMLSSLNHPNIVKFLNYVENEFGIFLIMEYVDGMTLEDYINKKTGLIIEKKAYPMMCKILDAFAYAHDRNVIHRDIKPGNIFVTKDGNIKILDFGIAQIISETDNRSNDYSGTIEYMSPEQIKKQQLDIRSDIYSLGVVFHQMLTGKPPYDVANMSNLDIKKEIAGKPLSRMKDTYEYVSDGIQSVVDRATSKDPNERYENCHKMKAEIVRLDRGTGNDGPTPPTQKKSSKGWLVGVCAGVVVLIAGALGYFYYINNSNRQYNDFVTAMGVPSGIGKISGNADSTSYYRITYSGGKPIRATYVNPNGQPTEITDSILAKYKPVDAEFVYNEKGSLDYKNVYDRHGKLLYKIDYDDDLCDAVIERYPIDSAKVVDSDTVPPTHYGLTYNEKGYLVAVHYNDTQGKKRAYRGVYGESFKYDASGRLLEVRFLDENYNPTEDETGIGIIHFEYSGPLCDVKTFLYNKDGRTATPTPPKAKVNTKPKTPKPKKKSKYPTPIYKYYQDSVAYY